MTSEPLTVEEVERRIVALEALQAERTERSVTE